MKWIIGIGIGVVAGGLIGYFGKCVSGTCPLTSNPYVGAFFGGLIAVLLLVKR